MESLLHDLNAEQTECVLHDAEVLQILAGPGSGKTRVLTVRIALAITRRHIPPDQIVVVTFTNKAALELKERLAVLIGNDLSRRLIVGTFHSVSLRYLQRYGINIGLHKKITVADTAESKNVISKVSKGLRKQNLSTTSGDSGETQMTPMAALSHISTLKNKGISAIALLDTKVLPLSLGRDARAELAIVYAAYQDHLVKHALLDFDDLIISGIELLKSCPEVVSNIKHVFVDEYQDTSNQQYELMQLLAQRHKNLTIVGDHDQSIYGFRAADIKNFERMYESYTNCVVYHLKQNYRSSGAIVFAASAVIEQDSCRPQKRLETQNVLGTQPTLRVLDTAKSEADWIAREVNRLVSATQGLLKIEDVAILVRSASLTLPVEQALQRHKIQYRLCNARKFLERPHIKLLINYLRVIDDKATLAIVEVVNIPSRKFGQISIDNLLLESHNIKRSLWETLKLVSQGSLSLTRKRDPRMEANLRPLVRTIEKCRGLLANDSEVPVRALLQVVIDEIKFETYVKKQYPEDYCDRLEDVQEFLQTADILGEDQEEQDLPRLNNLLVNDVKQNSLERLLASISLMSDSGNSDEDSKNSLIISTIHSAKGLEWPVVFIPGAYHGSIPSARAMDTEQDEERRLLYVAMTRAKALLYMSWPRQNARFESVQASAFLTHSKIVPLLDSRSPKITIHVLKELSQVLHRTIPNLNQFQVSEDDYEDRSNAVLADEDYELALNRGKFVKRKAEDRLENVELGFSTASEILRTIPPEEAQFKDNFMAPTNKKVPQIKKSKSGQSNIKAFFGPSTSVKKQASEPNVTTESRAIPEDYRVVLLSSSPEQERPMVRRQIAQPTHKTIPQELPCTNTNVLNPHIMYNTENTPSIAKASAPIRKRLGMSRPRILKR